MKNIERKVRFECNDNFPSSLYTPTLNPNRPADHLTHDIYELIKSQSKIITCLQFRNLINNTFQSMSANIGPTDNPLSFDFVDILWVDLDKDNKIEEESRGRGRSRSPDNKESRKIAHSLPSKPRNNKDNTQDSNINNDNNRKEKNVKDVEGSHSAERRSRSSSMGKRINTGNGKQINRNNYTGSNIRSTNHENKNLNKKTISMSSLSILKGLPDNIDIGACRRGPVNGIWLINHPLTSSPQSMIEMSETINESSLSTNKKIESLLDVQRDYDIKRFYCYEKFLSTKRSTINDVYIRPNNSNNINKLKNNRKQSFSNIDRERGSYYSDTGKALNAW
jgi:hypothetical protein